MIWSYIYEFFVKYIFGGVWWNGNVEGLREYYPGAFYIPTYGISESRGQSTAEFLVDFNGTSMAIGNYFSLICTIIVMGLIVWFCIWLVIWVFKLVAHAFLLK